MKLVKLKLGTLIDNRLMYRVYRNQGQGPTTLGVTSFDRFYNLSLKFRYRFLRKYENCKFETLYTLGQWDDVSCISESG